MILFSVGFAVNDPQNARLPRVCYQTFTRDALPGQVTVSSSAGDGTPADAPLRPDTFEYWQAATLPATWAIDFVTPREVDYVGIAGHTIGTDRARILVEYANSLIGSPPVPNYQPFAIEGAPANDAPLLFLNTAVFARYWRITLTGPGTGGTGTAPKIPVVYIGKALVMPYPIYGGHAPLNMQRDTTLTQMLSRGGQFMGQLIQRQGMKTSVEFKHLTAAWVRTYLDPFIQSARKFPYFFAWRPGTFPAEIGYVWTAEDIHPSNMGMRDMMAVSWSLRGIGAND